MRAKLDDSRGFTVNTNGIAHMHYKVIASVDGLWLLG